MWVIPKWQSGFVFGYLVPNSQKLKIKFLGIVNIKNFHYNGYFPRFTAWWDGQKISVEVLLWSVLPDVSLHCSENSQASPFCISGNSKMNIAWDIGGMIMTGKSLHQCHFVHLIPHMNWHGIRTWVFAVRDMRLTAWIKARSPHGRLQRMPWDTCWYCRGEGGTVRLGFPHGTGFTVSYQRLCIGFSSYRSNSASLTLPPREMVEFHFPGTLCRILET
jgi:hypothetical protein